MTHFITPDDEIQYKPFLIVGFQICDCSTGEVLYDLKRPAEGQNSLKKIRSQIDWRASLSRLSVACGAAQAVSVLLAVYVLVYPDYPYFVPGFVSSLTSGSPTGREEDGEQCNRGLSNSNKVQTVIIRNVRTGELIELDKKKARISRMRRRVFSWANTVAEYLPARGIGFRHRKVMITLTYAEVDGWRPNHIQRYMKELKRRLGSNLIAIACVAELQERGAVHYHIELICKKGTRIPMPDKSGMWPHGMSKIETAKSIFYICSYLKKAYQKEGNFPKGLRMFSVWIAPGAVSALAAWLFRLSSLPQWLCDKIAGVGQQGSKWFRNPGGGWWYAGHFFRSPFQFLGYGKSGL